MSGGNYTENFGTRMKDHPRPSRKGLTLVKSPIWVRCRRCFPVQGGYAGARRGPWVYFFWTGKVSGIDLFAREVCGSFREVERLTADRPQNIATAPYNERLGVRLYLENL